MKKYILSILFILGIILTGFTQDAITKKSGEDIQAKILEVNQNEVKYKKFDNLDGPTFSMLKSDILLIRYSNGTKDIFNEEKKTELTGTSEELVKAGKDDAIKYYDGYKGAGGGTLAATLVSGAVIGLIPAITCSSAAPKTENLNFPNAEKMKNPDYFKGYTRTAYKIKKNTVWYNYSVGVVINIVAIVLLTR